MKFSYSMLGISFCITVISNIFVSVFGQIQCSRNCSALSVYGGNHAAYFSVQKNSCSNISNQGFEFPRDSSDCRNTQNSKKWYLYDDPDDGKYQKIALNFTWSPCEDGTIEFLRGFSVMMQSYPNVNMSNPISDYIYFCFLHKLEFHKHIKAKFYYDRFGYNDSLNIQPGQNFNVSIFNLPVPSFSRRLHQVSINIPTCDDSQLANVFICQQQSMFTMSYLNHSCTHLTAVIEYNVPSYFGNSAILSVASITPSGETSTVLQTWKNQSLHENFTIPFHPDANRKINYSVTLWGNTKADIYRVVHFSFKDCIIAKDEILAVTMGITALLVLVLIIISLCLKRLKSHKSSNAERELPLNKNKPAIQQQNLKTNEVVTELLNRRVKVYIIFFNDHPKHTEVVSKFADYLIGDLAFDVVFQLYETRQLYRDPVDWMMKSLEKCDKVIVIWSPGAAKRWHSCEEKSAVNHDFFLPVLKKIRQELFLQNNLLKYVFVYFNYVSKVDIPAEFIEGYSHLHFRLMQQLTDFYFRLIGKERYLSNAVVLEESKVRSNAYFDNNATGNKFGKILHETLVEMMEYVKKNPYWYNEKIVKEQLHEKSNIAGGESFEILKKCTENNFTESVVDMSISEEVHSEVGGSMYKSSFLARSNSLHGSSKFDSAILLEDPLCLSSGTVYKNQDVQSVASSVSTAESCSLLASKSSFEVQNQLTATKTVEQVLFPMSLGSFEPGSVFCKNELVEDCSIPGEKPVEISCRHLQCDSGFSSEASPFNYSLFELAPLKQDEDPMDFLVTINKENGM